MKSKNLCAEWARFYSFWCGLLSERARRRRKRKKQRRVLLRHRVRREKANGSWRGAGNPSQLRQFLKKMPKGADLHYHLSGGAYAESFIRAAVEDGLCVDVKQLAFTKCPAGGDGDKTIVPASDAYKSQALYDQLINAFSMRSFVPYAGVSGTNHFFDTFGKFGGTNASHKPEWLDESRLARRGANEQYLELMETPDFSIAARAAGEVGWKDDFKELREALVSAQFERKREGGNAVFRRN